MSTAEIPSGDVPSRRSQSRDQARRDGWRAAADRRRHPVEPVVVVVDPLEAPTHLAATGRRSLFVGSVGRFATCTGVSWLDDARLVVAYLLTGTLATYEVSDVAHAEPTVERMWAERDVFAGATPTTLAADSSRSFVAIPLSRSAATPAQVVLAPIEADRVEVGRRVVVASEGDRNLHGVDVSPDGRFLVWTAIGQHAHARGLRVVPLLDDSLGVPTAGARHDIPVGKVDLPPKGVAFSPDGRVVALAFGPNASFRRGGARRGHVELREWCNGEVGDPLCSVQADMVCPEDVAFHPEGDRIAITDQIRQRAHVHAVDLTAGRIERRPARTISWASGGLHAPHACAFSPTGRWLAITNYGDASLRLFDVGSL